MLHRFAKFVAACTVILVLAGSFVTSTGSGLSVPDWPTTYGWNMFTFPPSKWVGGIFYEHGHRLIASTVGFLTIVLAAWLWRAEPRRWMKWLGVVALVAVIVQGVLGGLTVLFFLPAPISTAHAGLAEVFFCLTIAIALFTSPSWLRWRRDGSTMRRLRRLATMTTALVYVQILVGATMRHTGAGLAIPDFPLMFGHLVPDHWSAAIAVHFAHRLGALIVTLSIILTSRHVWTHHAPAAAAALPGGAPARAGDTAGDARRPDHPHAAQRMVQQPACRRRGAGAGNVAGADAAQLAQSLCARPTRRRRDARRERDESISDRIVRAPSPTGARA